MRMLSRTMLAVIATLAVGCGGDNPIDDADGGRMDGMTAPPDDAMTMPDTGPVTLCAADSECDDGVYCNGAETCMIGEPGAGANGCLAGSDPCDAGEGEICDETDESCVSGSCDGANADMDGDGDDRIECGGSDCDDGNAGIYGTAQEVCDADGVDEDCDPSTIQDDTSDDGDVDGDGYISTSCFNVRSDGGENRGDDCDDASTDIHPDVLDACGGGDADCDGMIDEDPDRTYYYDSDEDGYGIVSSTIMACSAPTQYASMDGDCDDENRNINPGRGEPCNGIDDDCSGIADDPVAGTCDCEDGMTQDCGPTTEVGECRFGTSTCVAGAWGPCVGERMASTEICNGLDDDCDGSTDDMDSGIADGDVSVTGAREWWYDEDGDGYGTSTNARIACIAPPLYVISTLGDDCVDTPGGTPPGPPGALINPGRIEMCNGYDDNCTMGTDEGCDCTNGTTRRCPGGTDEGECDRGMQICSAGAWGPCIGRIDPADTEDCTPGDEDCDGFENDADPDIAVRPVSDTGANTYWRDMDLDGYGTDTDTRNQCVGVPSGYVAPRVDMSDCDDDEVRANHGLRELDFPCFDGIDNDCDGTTDDTGNDRLYCYTDRDGDGYGSGGATRRCTCDADEVTTDGDCVDNGGARSALVYPGATAYQMRGHCNGQTPCAHWLTGTDACSVWVPGGPGGGSDRCAGPVDWDYNCDSVVTPESTTCRYWGPPTYRCSGGRGPTASHASSNCGNSVEYGTCCGFGSCGFCSLANEPLACR